MIECAVRADGSTSPATDFLDQLACGMWADDPDADGLPDDTQIKHYDKLLNFCHTLANTGEPPYVHSVNYLRDGIWEFKIGAKRLTFFDTPGDGTYTPKPKGEGGAESAGREYWWFPNFDEHIRLGYAFPKTAEKAGDGNIRLAETVRLEDLEHDKAT